MLIVRKNNFKNDIKYDIIELEYIIPNVHFTILKKNYIFIHRIDKTLAYYIVVIGLILDYILKNTRCGYNFIIVEYLLLFLEIWKNGVIMELFGIKMAIIC